jgi:replication factor A1
MHKKSEDLYESVKDIITKTEFEEKIQKEYKERDELLDKDTIALLIVDELGRNNKNISPISSLVTGKEGTVFGKVIGISEERSFSKKNGYSGKVVNLQISDDTGKCGLVLWDKDVELVKSKIQIGTNLKVINGYVKQGLSGLEINVGRWGLLEIEPDDMPNLNKNSISETQDIDGELIEIEPTRSFFKDSGDFGFVTNIKIKNQEKTESLVIWDEKIKEIRSFKKGDYISISSVSRRIKNGNEEIHVNGKCLIKKLQQPP